MSFACHVRRLHFPLCLPYTTLSLHFPPIVCFDELSCRCGSCATGIVNRDRDRIRQVLIQTTFGFPQIIDVKWRLDHNLWTKHRDQVAAPVRQLYSPPPPHQKHTL